MAGAEHYFWETVFDHSSWVTIYFKDKKGGRHLAKMKLLPCSREDKASRCPNSLAVVEGDYRLWSVMGVHDLARQYNEKVFGDESV